MLSRFMSTGRAKRDKEKADKATNEAAIAGKKKSPDRVRKKLQKKNRKQSPRTKKRAEDESAEEDVLAAKEHVVDDSIEAQIEATKQSIINQELMKEARLKDRLQYLEASKVQRDGVKERWPGLSFEVGLRLDWFTGLREFLADEGDPCKVLPTIEAIMEAYKSERLRWMPGYVTYWSKGKQLTELRVFDWEEFLGWNFQENGGESFWVEGLRNSHPTRRFWKRTIGFPGQWNPPADSEIDPKTAEADYAPRVKLPILLRMMRPKPGYDPKLDPSTNLDPDRPLRNKPPGWYNYPVPREALPASWEHKLKISDPVPIRKGHVSSIESGDVYAPRFFWMDDDTGCDVCTIMESDVDSLIEAARETIQGESVAMPADLFPPALLGYVSFKESSGKVHYQPVRALEINMMGEEKHLMLKAEWDIIEVAIAPDQKYPDLPIRLLGPWLRHRFYTATVPDSSSRLWVLNKGHRLREVPFRTQLWFSGMLPGLAIIEEKDLPAGATIDTPGGGAGKYGGAGEGGGAGKDGGAGKGAGAGKGGDA